MRVYELGRVPDVRVCHEWSIAWSEQQQTLWYLHFVFAQEKAGESPPHKRTKLEGFYETSTDPQSEVCFALGDLSNAVDVLHRVSAQHGVLSIHKEEIERLVHQLVTLKYVDQ